MGICMNLFFVVILAALLVDYILDLVSNLLNLQALKFELPPGLTDIYTPEDYRKSQEYLRISTRFGLIQNTSALIITLVFWFLRGFNYFDRIVQAWGFSTIISGLLYIGILLLIYQLIILPFSIYDTFVIEQRFGFNKTTRKLFVQDHLKGLGLVLGLGIPTLAGVLALFEYTGHYAWLYCWAGVALISLILQFISPILIMPLFNKFTPMPPGELRDAILDYTRSVYFPVKDVLIMDASKRSRKSNAFFTGFGRSRRIALFDTLVQKHTNPELIAILAHEIGHYKKKHIPRALVISIMHLGLLFFLLSVFVNSPGLYQAFYMQQYPIYAGFLFFGLLYTPIELILSIIMQVISRRNEYQADRFAAETIAEPDNLIIALKNLSGTNLANLTPHPFYVFLHYSHPPLLQRIQAIQNIKNKQRSLA